MPEENFLKGLTYSRTEIYNVVMFGGDFHGKTWATKD